MLPLFAGLCLLAPATAFASVVKPEEECAIATTQPPPPVSIAGLRDTEFIARMIYQLDDFWAKHFTNSFTRQTLGLTDAVLETYAPGKHIRLPRDWWYKPAKVVIYDGTIETSIGLANSSDTPFYLTKSRKLYISDHSLRTGLNGFMSSDANWAYLLAHEVGHHVQEHIGMARFILSAKPIYKNHLTMRMELQADCLAGFWIGRNRSMFTHSEIVSIVEFTGKIGGGDHGSNKQRVKWLLRGMSAETVKDCDTFRVSAGKL